MRQVDVETQNGVVTLSGAVGSEPERRRALALARNTEGVREVSDQLKIDSTLREAINTDARGGNVPAVPPLRRPDPWITMKIQSQFFLEPEIKGQKIDVDTKGGVVTLKGTVATAAQKQETEQIARDTEGVTRVVNQLTVAGG
jgi:hyperosmotically inducible protein